RPICGANACTARNEPQTIKLRASVTPAPQRSVRIPPTAATLAPVTIPVASRSPSPASERSNVRSMSIAATANAPPKNPNAMKPDATGFKEGELTPQSRAAAPQRSEPEQATDLRDDA